MISPGEPASGAGLAPAYAAARARLGLVAALIAIAVIAWVWTIHSMRGMDAGPWTRLGSLGWFLGVWVVMMAAMMLPSVAPVIALYTRITKDSSPASPWLFTLGYVLVWTGAGLIGFSLGGAASSVLGGWLAWDEAGHALAAGTLMVAATYEVTPFKNVCLAKCRSPLGSLLGSWRGGRTGALRMGVRNGAWCVGCCWALMASLFALGVMSVSWMALVAAIIAAEKTLPWRHLPIATAALLLGMGLVVLLAPEALPGLTIPPGDPMQMD